MHIVLCKLGKVKTLRAYANETAMRGVVGPQHIALPEKEEVKTVEVK